MTATANDFANELSAMLAGAAELGLSAVEISAGDLHRRVGGYPGTDHRMPMSCAAMEKAMQDGDALLPNTLKKYGASFTVRYALPR